MSDYIVLVKQVPDVSQITDNAFNPETGTLIRSRLENVINELDAQALAFADHMRRVSGDEDGRVICLTMGPPMADDVLRYGLSRCADLAVLLTDRALSGADTVATANPLAFAIRKIQAEILGGSHDYFIVAGMQSVDGDTAQVPAQIAEEMSIGCIPYLTHADWVDGRFHFTRILSGGNQVVVARGLPVVLTVAKHEYPLFASFAASRRARRIPLIKWGAADIHATLLGGKGSKTQVTRVFPPGKTSRKCQEVASAADLARLIRTNYHDGASHGEGGPAGPRHNVQPGQRPSPFDRGYEAVQPDIDSFGLLAQALENRGIKDLYDIDDETRERIVEDLKNKIPGKSLDDLFEGMKLFQTTYKGEVWVVAEHSRGVILPATFELIGKARDLADSLGTSVGVALVGKNVADRAREMFEAGADRVYLVEHDRLEEFDPLAYRKAVAALVERHWPQIVLFAATPGGRVLAPMVSYRLHCGLTADCTSLEIRDRTRKGEIAILLQTRPALGGNVMATICTKESRVQMATMRPGVVKRLPPDPTRTGEVIREEVDITEQDQAMDVLSAEYAQANVDLGADVIVSGGKGLQNRDSYQRLLDSLRDALSSALDTRVEEGASRTAVEQGFTDRGRQVGQTGTAISPKLYVALGISGAIQHMIGVANTETIVAVNNDPHAPIFKQCDYYIVGNVEKVVPDLVAALGGASS
jgi:electron transfer flavoprotein alpha subunit